MDLRSVAIETERLFLKPIDAKYRQDIFLAFTDRVSRYTWPQPTGNIADVDAFISGSSESMGRGEELQFVAVSKDSGKFIGCTGLHHLWTRPEPGPSS
jgi:ribosomal-protein-alanine N-acetyltransferase